MKTEQHVEKRTRGQSSLCDRGHERPRNSRCRECNRIDARERMRELRADPEVNTQNNAFQRKRYAEDPEYKSKRLEHSRVTSVDRYRGDPEYRRAQGLRQLKQRSSPETWFSTRLRLLASKSRKRGWEFTLKATDIPITTHCPVFGIQLEYGAGRNNPNSPSIDRIDNQLGYVPGNVWIISLRANTLKGDATLAELELLTAALRTRGAR